MSNWLFLMLLYGFFGWMKKRQRDKARDKIESQDDWDTGGIVDFGEGILEAIMGDENSEIEKSKTIKEEDIDEEEYLDEFEEVLVESPKIEPEIDLILNETPSKDVSVKSNNVRNVNINNTKLANLIDLQDPVRTGVIFKESLEKYGTRVKTISKKKTSNKSYKKISNHLSKPLIHSATNLMNESDNLSAELFVKSIGALDTLPGTWKVGLDSIKSFLAKEVLIDTSNIRLADASGVSRYNLTSAAQLNSLLKWMYNSEYKDDFISTLPGGGWEKSTLEKRLVDEGDLVRAKTGGLSGVRNLAGYIKSKKYGDVAFSILMNGYTDYSSRYARVHDQIVKSIIYD